MTYRYTKGLHTIVVAGQDDVEADSAEDTLTFIAGSNITITTDGAGDSITISATGGGGGSNYGVYTAGGYFKVYSNTKIYGHVWEGYVTPGQWTYGLGSAPTSAADGDTLSLTAAVSLAYMGYWHVPSACTVSKLAASWYVPSNTSSDGRWRMRLWKCTPANDSTASITWTAIGSGAVSSDDDNSAVYNVSEDLSSSSNNSVAAGDILALTFDGRNIGGSNYGSSNSNNRQTFRASLLVEWS
jgi:hypothetical protein